MGGRCAGWFDKGSRWLLHLGLVHRWRKPFQRGLDGMWHRYTIYVNRRKAVVAFAALSALTTWAAVAPVAVARLPVPWGSFLRVAVPMRIDGLVAGSHRGLRRVVNTGFVRPV